MIDLDIAALAAHLPQGAKKLEAFTRSATIVEKNDPNFVAAVRLTKNGVVIYISPEQWEKVVFNLDDGAFVIFHEWLHIIQRHQDIGLIARYFNLPIQNEKDIGTKVDSTEWGIVKYVQELEIKHLEHLLLADDKYHQVNKRLYAEAHRDEDRALYRHSSSFESPYFTAIHGRVFSDGEYSLRETFMLLKEYYEQNPDKSPRQGDSDSQNDGEGEGGSNSPASSQDGRKETQSDSSTSESGKGDLIESGIDPDAEDLFKDLTEALKEMMGEVEGGDGSSLSETSMIAEIKRVENRRRISSVDDSIERAAIKPSHAKILRQQLSGKRHNTRSRQPNFTSDRNAQKDFVMGRYRFKFKNRRYSPPSQVAFYYDMSGSQSKWLPLCNEIVLQNKTLFMNNKLYPFSTYVKEVSTREFLARVQDGTTGHLLHNSGTNFNAVIQHVAQSGFKKIVVLTDNKAKIREDLIEPLKKRGLHISLLLTCDSERWRDKGFYPYIDSLTELWKDPSFQL